MSQEGLHGDGFGEGQIADIEFNDENDINRVAAAPYQPLLHIWLSLDELLHQQELFKASFTRDQALLWHNGGLHLRRLNNPNSSDHERELSRQEYSAIRRAFEVSLSRHQSARWWELATQEDAGGHQVLTFLPERVRRSITVNAGDDYTMSGALPAHSLPGPPRNRQPPRITIPEDSPPFYLPPHEHMEPEGANRFKAYQEAAVAKNEASEAADRKKIEEWESTQRCWSGTGNKHVESEDLARPVEPLNSNSKLGAGAHGVVDKVKYGGVLMARKKIDRNVLHHEKTLEEVRGEAQIMEKLNHRHIATLIGTYTQDGNRFLNILTYPVAVCDLEQLLEDFEQLRREEYGQIMDIADRVKRLGFADLTPVQFTDETLRKELMTMMSMRMMECLGCVTDAMEYVHAKNIKHQDIKPRNILLSPGKCYLTDFGISGVLREPKEEQSVDEYAVGYVPPEVVFNQEHHHPSAVDVYSLGAIFLNVVVLPPGFPRCTVKEVLNSMAETREDAIADICNKVQPKLTGGKAHAADDEDHSVSSKHILGLVKTMLLTDPDERPDMRTVNARLHELGGLEQIYHAACCKRDNRWMTARFNSKIMEWETESVRRYDEVVQKFNNSLEEKENLKEENERLKAEVERLKRVAGVGSPDAMDEDRRSELAQVVGHVGGDTDCAGHMDLDMAPEAVQAEGMDVVEMNN